MIGKKASVAVSAIVVAAAGAALLAKGRSAAHAERERGTVGLAAAGPVRDVTKQPFSATPDPATQTSQPAETASLADPAQGLKLMQQRFRRGGYGSKVLTSFTLVNSNDFAVKDVAMRCDFAGADGRYVSSRQRLLPEIVKQKSRKRVGPTLVGFVTPMLPLARCNIASASRA